MLDIIFVPAGVLPAMNNQNSFKGLSLLKFFFSP